MKKFLYLLLFSFLAVSCSPKGSQELEREYGKGHNGILWGEGSVSAAGWIRGQMGAPVKIIKQDNPRVLQQTQEVRKRYLKRLSLRSASDINDSLLVTYYYAGFQYVMSFDMKDKFCAVTFGPPMPFPPVTKDAKMKETRKVFEKRILNPLVEKYGKPRTIQYGEKGVERSYWVWKSKQLNFVLEFVFVGATAKTPAQWQYSETVLLVSPKSYQV